MVYSSLSAGNRGGLSFIELTRPSKLLKQALLQRGADTAAELALHAAHQRLVVQGNSDGQFVVQRASSDGAEVTR